MIHTLWAFIFSYLGRWNLRSNTYDFSPQLCRNGLRYHQSLRYDYVANCETGTVIFLWILPNFVNLFIEHLRTAASDIVTENSRGNSAQNDKLCICIICPVDVWLGFKCASAQMIILKKLDEKCWKQSYTKMLNDWTVESQKRNRHISTRTIFWH